MEAYTVWASLNLKGDAAKKLEQLSKTTQKLQEDFKKLDTNIHNVSLKLSILSETSKKSLQGLKSVVEVFKNLSSESYLGSKRMSALNTALNSTGSRMETISSKTRRLSDDLAKLSDKAASASLNIGELRAGAGMGAIKVAGGGPRRSSRLRDLGMLSLGTAGGPIGDIAMGYMMAGAPGAAVSGMLDIGTKGFQQGTEFENQVSILKLQGLSSTNIQKAIAQANAVKLPGATQLTMMKAIVDAQMATQNFSFAQKMAPTLAKMRVSGSTYSSFSDTQMQNAIRFAELMGHSDVESISKWLSAGFKMMSISGGSVMPTGMRTFGRMIAGVGSRLKPEAFAELEPVIQSLGEHKTGTGLTTGIGQLISGVGLQMNKKRVERLTELGLGSAKYNKYGTQMKFQMNPKYTEDLVTDPIKFILQDFIPLLKKAGITSEAGIHQEMINDFPTTFARDAVQIYKDRQKISNISKNYRNLQDIDQGYKTTINTPQGKLNQLSAAFDKMAFAFNKLSSPVVIGGIDLLIKLLGWLEKFFGGISKLRDFADSGSFAANPFAYEANKIHSYVQSSAKEVKASHSPYINSKNAAAVTVVSPISIDGKKVAQSVSHHLFDLSNSFGTLGSSMNFNSALSAYPTAHNYSSPF